MSSPNKKELRVGQLLSFFIPLGFSASLVTLSHVIINSTLARAENAELTIATFAIAMSMFAVTERPVNMLRQTCSALVRDKRSLRAMSFVTLYVIAGLFAVSFLIAYSPLGVWIFTYLFGVSETMLLPILNIYKVLMFVSIFSGIRCFFHGIIIFNMRTKWLTIGMIIRLIIMYLLSLFFIKTGKISGQIGALIFLIGMFIECLVSVWEGRSLVKKIPEKKEGHSIESKSHIFGFYRPLLFSTAIAVIIGPAINAFLGKTSQIELSIASFALAVSIVQLVVSFFTYMHQIVLNFYRDHSAQVIRFSLSLSLIPSVILGLLCYTSMGPWFLENIMGANEHLLQATLANLRIFMIMTLVFPWLDFGNGILMLRGQTQVMVKSQIANVAFTLITLFLLIVLTPGWNGMIGALAQSLGLLAELIVILYVLKITSHSSKHIRDKRENQQMLQQ